MLGKNLKLSLKSARKVMYHCRVDYVLKNLHSDRQMILVSQLIQICEVFVSNDLVLVVTEAEKYHSLPMLEPRIHYLHLHELACELNWH